MSVEINRTVGQMTSAPGADEREIVFTRSFAAPRELVWKAWTEPERMAKWWGPRDLTNPVIEMDLRPGGAYLFVMRSPDGTDYPMRGVYLEIVQPERLIMTDTLEEQPGDWQEMLNQYRGSPDINAAFKLVFTILFEEQDGQTTVRIISRFDSVTDRDAILKMGMTEGWAESLDTLESLLG